MSSFTFLCPDAPRPTATNNPFPIFVDWLAAPIELEELDAEEWDRLYEFILECQTERPPELDPEAKLRPDVTKWRKHNTLRLLREAQSEVEWRLREMWYQAGGQRSAPPLSESMKKTLHLPTWTGKSKARKNVRFDMVRPAPAVEPSSAVQSQAGSEDEEGDEEGDEDGDGDSNRDEDEEMTVIEVIERNKSMDKGKQRMDIKTGRGGKAQSPAVTAEKDDAGHDYSAPDVDMDDDSVPIATPAASEARETTPSPTIAAEKGKGRAVIAEQNHDDSAPDVHMDDDISPVPASMPIHERPDDTGDSNYGETTPTPPPTTSNPTLIKAISAPSPPSAPLPPPPSPPLPEPMHIIDTDTDVDTDTQSYTTALEHPDLRDEEEGEAGYAEEVRSGARFLLDIAWRAVNR